jgi:hypothetical protein
LYFNNTFSYNSKYSDLVNSSTTSSGSFSKRLSIIGKSFATSSSRFKLSGLYSLFASGISKLYVGAFISGAAVSSGCFPFIISCFFSSIFCFFNSISVSFCSFFPSFSFIFSSFSFFLSSNFFSFSSLRFSSSSFFT